MLLFQKLITETQISKPPEATRLHNFIKLVILLPLRAIYFRSQYYETPCRSNLDFIYFPPPSTVLTSTIVQSAKSTFYFLGRFLSTKRRQAMLDVGSHREGRWLGNTTCKKVPVEFCGNGCIIEEGPEVCKDEKLYSLGNIHILRT